MSLGIDVVTGSYSYTGRYVTRRLVDAGRQVRTLTGHPQQLNPFGDQVKAFPYDFDHPDRLIETLRGAETLYNTYWVRYPHGRLDYDVAARNLLLLIQAAVRAGVKKIVHVSIINAFDTSPYAYFRGKARVERAIQESGLPYTILRPTVIFGPEDILINNMAWMVRSFPLFMLPGSGNCLIQPIFVEDFADLVVASAKDSDSKIIDAVGPEIFTYRELVELLAKHLGRRPYLLPTPARLVHMLGSVLGWFLGDVILTYEEVIALMDSILYSVKLPTGTTRLSEWIVAHKDQLGREYRSELKRHF